MAQKPTSGPISKPIKESGGPVIVASFCLGSLLYALTTWIYFTLKRTPHDKLATIVFVDIILFGVPFLPILASLFLIYQRNKFGRAILLIDTHPARTGEEITGTIKVSRELAGFDFIELRVVCLAIRDSSYEIFTNTLASQVSKTPRNQLTIAAGKTFIPVKVVVPDWPTQIEKGLMTPKIRWQLHAETMPHEGMHFTVDFKLPVVQAETRTTLVAT